MSGDLTRQGDELAAALMSAVSVGRWTETDDDDEPEWDGVHQPAVDPSQGSGPAAPFGSADPLLGALREALGY